MKSKPINEKNLCQNQLVSLCLIVWNEIEGCKVDIPNLPVENFHEVYAVDGGSTDGTREYLQSQGIQTYVQPVKSLNAAYHYAVELCTGDSLIIFFPKGNLDPNCVLEIAQGLKENNDLVIASRNIKHGKNEEDCKLFRVRKWGVKFLSVFIALMWKREGYRIRDVLHGVKGFSISSFNKMLISEIGLTVDLEMVIRSYKLRQSRKEIPVVEGKRIAGETHFKIFPTSKKLTYFLIKELIKS